MDPIQSRVPIARRPSPPINNGTHTGNTDALLRSRLRLRLQTAVEADQLRRRTAARASSMNQVG